jgi:hypothetical protein
VPKKYDPINARGGHLKRTYGITLAQYDELLAKQDEKCAICLKHESEFNVKLAVDHDHISGEIRGLLCRYCNHRLVGRHRDADLLRRIADYIEKGTGLFVPPKKKRPRKTRRKVKNNDSNNPGSEGSPS